MGTDNLNGLSPHLLKCITHTASLSGASGVVGAAALCSTGDDKWHDQRGGWDPTTPVSSYLHSPLWEREVISSFV